MKFVIIGAGISGLAAGIALRRAGHNVLILEKSQMLREIGAAIVVQPNASSILTKWGFSFTGARGTVGRYLTIGSVESLELFSIVDEGEAGKGGCLDRYGGERYLMHRADLHSELMRLALDHGVEILKGKQVTGIDSLNGTVFCSDDSVYQADLIIGADGIHSVAVHSVLGRAPKLNDPYDNYRMLIPTEKFEEFWKNDDDDDSDKVKSEDNKFKIWDRNQCKNSVKVYVDPKKGDYFVWIPIRENKIQYVALSCPILSPDEKEVACTKLFQKSKTVDNKNATALMEGFHPALKKMISIADKVENTMIYSRETLPSWHRNRVLLIGDAAHAMLPFHGQGAAQAVQDAGTLEELFSGFDLDSGDKSRIDNVLEKRLQIFEKIRKKQVNIIEIMSNNPGAAGEDLRPLLGDLTEVGILNTPKDISNFAYTHDVVSLTRDMLAIS